MRKTALLFLISLSLILSSCQVIPTPQLAEIQVSITLDGSSTNINVPANSTVQNVLAKAGISIGSLDRVDPPLASIITSGDEILVVRVVEEYYDKKEVVPFDHQTIKNESLPEGESRVLQSGTNGEKTVTYKRTIEDGQEVSNIEFKSVIITNPSPEIVMIGVQSPFSSKSISGILAYIDNGNAWVIEGATGNRRPVVTTGDLDSHIFSISLDRTWLLYSRKSLTNANYINSLWAVRIDRDDPTPIDLQIRNVIHFADWLPNSSQTIAYSTVEPRSTAPGWQANNDLYYRNFSANGTLSAPIKKVEANSGGIYGWWGTNFEWSPDGSKLAYYRPDAIGTVDLLGGKLNQALPIIPYETHSDWAWVPGFSWSPDSRFWFAVNHEATADSTSPESSPHFSLNGLPVDQKYQVTLNSNSGMFANPETSPMLPNGSYLVSYLQAIFPDQSDTSRYRVYVMDQDGSNKEGIFPGEGSPGLNPQMIYWTPDFQFGAFVAIIYEGNLWLVDAQTKEQYQITGNGLISRLGWR